MNVMSQYKIGKIETIETLRGIASLMVCLYHLTKSNLPFLGSAEILVSVFAYGWLGVEIFFVLSGFIIPYSMIKSGYRIRNFFTFLAKRCIRIEPPYILSILLVVVLGFISVFMPGYKEGTFSLNLGQIVSHVAYLPVHLGFEWLSPVYWSLEAEFHYYILIALILPFLLVNRQCMYLSFILLWTASFFIPLYVFSYMPFFIAGIAACFYRFEKIYRYEFIVIVLISTMISLYKGQPIPMYLSIGLTSFVIAGVTFRSSVTDFLGKISFSLYLVHVPLGSKCLNFLGRYVDSEFKSWIAYLFGLLVCIFGAWVFYLLIERPCQKYSQKIQYLK